jgi:membrane-bound ClpP family serine protease
MKDSGKGSNLKAWLLALASLIDDILLLVILFVALKLFRVEITWAIILAVVAVVIAFFFIMHKAIVPAIRRRNVTGAEGLIGETAMVTQTLKPRGMVKVKDEYWNARSVEGTINVGEAVEVVGISGLVLDVKRKNHEQ